LELCFGGAKPIKDPRGHGTVWQTSVCFMQLTRKST